MICWGLLFGRHGTDLNVWVPIKECLKYIPVVLSGMVCAKSNWLNRSITIAKRQRGWSTVRALILLAIVLGLRVISGAELLRFCFIWVYSPFNYLTLVVILINLVGLKVLCLPLDWLGSYVSEIWLFNAVFTSGIF